MRNWVLLNEIKSFYPICNYNRQLLLCFHHQDLRNNFQYDIVVEVTPSWYRQYDHSWIITDKNNNKTLASELTLWSLKGTPWISQRKLYFFVSFCFCSGSYCYYKVPCMPPFLLSITRVLFPCYDYNFQCCWLNIVWISGRYWSSMLWYDWLDYFQEPVICYTPYGRVRGSRRTHVWSYDNE